MHTLNVSVGVKNWVKIRLLLTSALQRGWDQERRFNDLGGALEMNQYFLCSVTHLKQRVSPDIEMSELLKQTPAGWMAGCWGSVSKANTTYISDTRAVFALVNGSIESLLKLLRHPPSNGLFPPRTPRLIDECKSLTSPKNESESSTAPPSEFREREGCVPTILFQHGRS